MLKILQCIIYQNLLRIKIKILELSLKILILKNSEKLEYGKKLGDKV